MDIYKEYLTHKISFEELLQEILRDRFWVLADGNIVQVENQTHKEYAIENPDLFDIPEDTPSQATLKNAFESGAIRLSVAPPLAFVQLSDATSISAFSSLQSFLETKSVEEVTVEHIESQQEAEFSKNSFLDLRSNPDAIINRIQGGQSTVQQFR